MDIQHSVSDTFAEIQRASVSRYTGFPGGSMVKKKKKKNPPAVQDIWVQSLGWEDPLENETAAHCSIHAWEIPWTEEPVG